MGGSKARARLTDDMEHAFWRATTRSILFVGEEGLIKPPQLQFVLSKLHLTSEAYTTQSHAHTKPQKHTGALDTLPLKLVSHPSPGYTKGYRTWRV
jgi:hypothetical protein